LLLGRGALNLLCVGEIDEQDFETLEQFASTKLTQASCMNSFTQLKPLACWLEQAHNH